MAIQLQIQEMLSLKLLITVGLPSADLQMKTITPIHGQPGNLIKELLIGG